VGADHVQALRRRIEREGDAKMMAIVLATGLGPELEFLTERYPPAMLPLVDRPFIQHLVEFLVEQGVHRFEFVLSHLPEKIEDFLGDGSRWGSSFRFHLTRDPAFPCEGFKAFSLEPEEGQVLIAHADRLPQIKLDDFKSAEGPVAFCDLDDHGKTRWTGWALVPRRLLDELPADLDENGFADLLLAAASSHGQIMHPQPVLDIRSYRGLLAAHQAVLSKQFQGLFLSAREVEDGVWLSRNVALHPTAKIQPPVYIGENCRIEGNTLLGPYAIIGRDCVVGSASTIVDSIVFPRSYVGESLELNEVLVDRHRLINIPMGVTVSITDEFILGGISAEGLGGRALGVASRLMGILLLLLCWPLILATAVGLKLFRRGPAFFRREVVALPAASDESLWRTFEQWSFARSQEKAPVAGKWMAKDGVRDFFFRFLPGLVNVVKGEMRLVGVSPRTREEVLRLHEDWRALYLRSKAGLITESFIQYGERPSEDDLYSAEVFYAAMGGFVYDLKLALGYAERVLGRGSPAAEG
jgi:NDP-sugar pyrophosphorylase family protein/lipopolysaccharide/colanic/teichoic acid biosynthesis glycosyltransferase